MKNFVITVLLSFTYLTFSKSFNLQVCLSTLFPGP
jgi:hypothetical protein